MRSMTLPDVIIRNKSFKSSFFRRKKIWGSKTRALNYILINCRSASSGKLMIENNQPTFLSNFHIFVQIYFSTECEASHDAQ